MRKGVTLIELLVVVAIIGVLATIVFFSLMGAQARARDSQRASDLKQIQTAVEMFKEVNNRYPGEFKAQYSSYTGWWHTTGENNVKVDNKFADDLKNYLSILPREPKCGLFCKITDWEMMYKYAHNTDQSGNSDGYELDAGLEVREDLSNGDNGYSQKYTYRVGRNDIVFIGRYEVGTKLYLMDCGAILANPHTTGRLEDNIADPVVEYCESIQP